MKNKGFTIVELLGVVVILGILIAFAVPAMYKYLTKSRSDAMEIMAKAAFEAAHSKATSDVTLHSGTEYKIKDDLVKGGFMDKTTDPDDDRKECDGEVKINLSESDSDTGAELDNYVYRVHVKCSLKEINRIYTTDGQEVDIDDNFPYVLVTTPVDKNIQYKNSDTFNYGKIVIKPKNESVEVLETTYSSKDESFCTVDSSGKITPKKLGDCKIDAHILRYDKHKNLLGERTDTIDFKVVEASPSTYTVSHTPTDKKLKMVNGSATQSGQITITTTNASLETFTKSFSSSDTSICTVDNTGKVTPKKAGSCTITINITRKDATTNEEIGKLKNTVTYTVTNTYNPEYTISYTPSDKKIYFESASVYNTGQVNVTKKSGSSNTTTATYTSSDTSVCAIDSSGKITPKKLGTSTITTTVVEKNSSGTTIGTKSYTETFTIHNNYPPAYPNAGWNYSHTYQVFYEYEGGSGNTQMLVNKRYHFEVIAPRTMKIEKCDWFLNTCKQYLESTKNINYNGVASTSYKFYIILPAYNPPPSYLENCFVDIYVTPQGGSRTEEAIGWYKSTKP